MDIWSGRIALNEETQTHLEDIRLIDPTAHWKSDLPDETLHFRGFVNPALIPLYARAGPNLEVHTSATATAQWLKERLVGGVWMDDEDLERFQAIQCPVGVLIGVDGASTTELLIYGVLSVSGGGDDNRDERQLKIYASPLSGSMITRAQELSAPQSPEFAEFLPDLRSPSPKRKRVASLFDSAALHHKRVRQMVPQVNVKVKRESEEPAGMLRSRSASRAPPSRPGTATGHASGHARGKSITLVETETETETPIKQESPGGGGSGGADAESTVAENKNTISRTVVTCMRMYGFNRASSKSAKHDHTVTQADTEEFKAMYHATYRASTFALRKYLRDSPPVLEKQKAMGYIDDFLRLFCNDLHNELR